MEKKKLNRKELLKAIEHGLIKEIKLLPTHFTADIWVCSNLDNLAKHFNQRYGASIEYYKDEISSNQCWTLAGTPKSELKGEKRIVMNVNSFDLGTIVHEVNHVVYHLGKICQLETTYNSQEWVSYMLEYIFNQCIEKETYVQY
jgi:hypothetical protein